MKTKTEKPTDRPIAILHGECLLFDAPIPADAVPLECKGDYLIVADSETSGNHHVIDRKPGVKFFQKGDRRYMRNSEPTQIRCLHEKRHDSITLEPGTYEFGTQQEWDPFAENLRNVRD